METKSQMKIPTLRARIGNYRFGINFNATEHALFGRFMFGEVADTAGVLNNIPNSNHQMFFADFDDCSVTDMFWDLSKIADKYTMGDIHIFMSTDSEHFFVISPCHYLRSEIRLMLAECEYVDSKFVGVYMRDGVNAIRIIPKVTRNGITREIKPLSMRLGHGDRIYCTGMLSLLNDIVPSFYERLIPNRAYDNTTKEQMYIREYETIRF